MIVHKMNTNMLKNLKQDLKKYADPDKKISFQRFIKNKPCQYGYGDILIGVTVPKM